MNNNKQTAVKWLESMVDAMIQNGGDADLLAVLEHCDQAKELEKQQMIEFAILGWANSGLSSISNTAEQYYKETYGE